MRIGQGFDAHRFTTGDHVILGGVKIPHSHGIEAYSDGDVLLHAICDALLGAAALGDIGMHFSDQDKAHKNRNSREFMRDVADKLAEKKFTIINVDATLILQRPKIAEHKVLMQKNIAEDLGVRPDSVNVKATTTEHMGFTGREEGIAAMAVVLID
jgi:2-C-methyl-D-erythritol 2,4-cyclodiphosphate synthase